MKASVSILVFLIGLSLVGCQKSEAPQSASSELSSARSQSDEVGPHGPGLGKSDVVRSLTIKTTGGVAQEISGKKGDGKTGLTGTCDPSMFANFGFEIGETMGSRTGVAFVTEDSIATGQTGEIDLDWVLFEYAKLEGADFESKRFKSDGGTLTLATHNASAANRRMVGTIIASNLEPLDGLQAQPVAIEVQFDAEFSCGVQ